MKLKYFYKIKNNKLIKGTGYKIPDSFIEYDKNNPPQEFIILQKQELFEKAKLEKISEINKIAQEKIVSGFISNALGFEHLYQSEPTDQINLLGVVQTAQLTNESQLFKCSPDNGQTWEYKEHTPEQITQVLKDGKDIKIAILEKANQLKQQVKQAATIEEINTITWGE